MKNNLLQVKVSRLLFHNDMARKTIEYGNIDCPFQATIVKYEEDSRPVTIKLQYFLPLIHLFGIFVLHVIKERT